MFKVTVFVVLAVCGVAFSGAAYAVDRVYLANGDMLSGDLSFGDNGAFNVRTAYGVLSVPSSDVERFEMGGDQVEVYLGHDVGAPLTAVGSAPVMASAVAAPVLEVVPKAEKEVAVEIEEAGLWGAQWSGSANLGAGLRTGNSDNSSINVDGDVKAKWDKHRAAVKVDYNREEDDGSVTVDNRSLEASHDYFFAPKWFVESVARFEQDDIDLLDLRSIIAVGLGHQPFDRDDLSLKYVAGPGFQDEEFSNGTGDSSLTAQWSLDYSQKFYDDLFRVFHEHDLNAPSDDFGAFLLQSESGIRVPIRSGIIASGQVDFDYDNDPAVGTVEDDTTYSLKLGYEW